MAVGGWVAQGAGWGSGDKRVGREMVCGAREVGVGGVRVPVWCNYVHMNRFLQLVR